MELRESEVFVWYSGKAIAVRNGADAVKTIKILKGNKNYFR